MIALRKDRIEFIVAMIVLIASGWVGGFFGAIPVFLFVIYLLWNNRRYDDILIGFLFTLVLSDNLPDQYVGLAYAKQLKNLYILALFGIMFTDKNYFFPINPFIRKFIPFFIVATVALYASETLSVSIQKTLSYLLLFITVPTYVSASFRLKGSEIFRRIIMMIFFVVFIGIVLKYISPLVAISHETRLRGIFGNPNGLGVFVIIGTILLNVFREKDKYMFHPWAYVFIQLIFLLAAYWSGSRAALLAIIGFLALYQVFRLSLPIGLIFLIGLLMFNQELIDLAIEGIIQLGFGEQFRVDSLEEGSGRIVAWNFAWQNIQDYFYLGRGFAFDEHLMRSNMDFLKRQGHEGGVHNTYLIIWLNAGVVGLIFYFRAFFLNFISAAKKTKYAFPAMFAVMFSIMFEPWMASSLNPFTSLFVISLVVMSQEQFYSVTSDEEIETDTDKSLEQEVAAI